MGKTRSLISSKNSLQLKSYSELYDGKYSHGLFDGTHYAFIKVFSRYQEIFKSGVFAFGDKSIRNALYLINLQFLERPSGIRFALFVFSSVAGTTVVTTTELNSQLTFTVTAKGSRKILRLGFRSTGSWTRLRNSVVGSVARIKRKIYPNSGRAATRQKIISIRPNPMEVIKAVSTSVDTYGVGVIITPAYRSTLYRSFVSVATPDFKRKARLGQLPVNPYAMYRVEGDTGFRVHDDHYVYKPLSSLSSVVSRSDYYPPLSRADNLANHRLVDENTVISRLQTKITGNNTTNLGEDAFTAGQTLRLFTNSVKRLTASANAIRTGNWVDFAKVLKQAPSRSLLRRHGEALKEGAAVTNLLAELWLEYRYGWLPLLGSVSATLGAYANYIARNPRIVSVSASHKNAFSSESDILFGSSFSGTVISGKKSVSGSTKCRIGIHYAVDQPIVAMFASLGLTNPASLAWELTPFSFLVDWTVGIGSMLNSVSAFDGLVFHSGYKTYFTKERVSASESWSGSFEDTTYKRDESISAGWTSSAVRMQREPLTGFPSASFPALKNPYSVIHAANAAALFIVALYGTQGKVVAKSYRPTVRRPRRSLPPIKYSVARR